MVRRHPRDEIAARRRRGGVRVELQLPNQLHKLVGEAQAKYGVTRKQIVVSALMKYFTGEMPELRELARLGVQVLRRHAGETK
jgi:hypothetical protein